MNFTEDGFSVFKNVFTEEEIENFRSVCDHYFSQNTRHIIKGGTVYPGWCGDPSLSEINKITEDKRILDIITDTLSEGWIFTGHSDLHQNKSTGWHRDIEKGLKKVKGYKKGSEWSDDYSVIKVCILLQDHSDNNFGLWMRPGSQKKMGSPKLRRVGKPTCLHSNATDVIVFDQRIAHRGWDGNRMAYKNEFGRDRYLITLGYGLDNKHSHHHRAAATRRQRRQLEAINKNV